LGFDPSIAVTSSHMMGEVLNLARHRGETADCAEKNGIDRATVEARVTDIIRERRERSAFFPAQLFADPAWDILLALTLAHARQHRLDVTKLCHCAGVPPTTVLRWIATLEEEGILVRLDVSTDRRRKYVELSPEAWGKMGEYVSAVRPSRSLAA
jgi:DNA-binding MarR family transcriptional regulator